MDNINISGLWCERYRPKTLDDILLSKEVKQFFLSLSNKEDKMIPHLMFWGQCGTGKTSLAQIIVNDILKCEYLYINASDQNGIETVRGLITNFIETRSFDGKMKVVICDEFDGFSSTSGSGSSAQQALRNMMESYAPYVRFILTCNFENKVIDPIWSRVQAFHICPDRNDYIQRCLTVLKNEKITVSLENSQPLLALINKCYPDMRIALNELQKASITNNFDPPENINKEAGVIASLCFEMLMKKADMTAVRKYVIENEQKFKTDYNILLKGLFEEAYNAKIELDKKRIVLLIISEAMYYNQIVLDKEVNYFATCIKIGGVI